MTPQEEFVVDFNKFFLRRHINPPHIIVFLKRQQQIICRCPALKVQKIYFAEVVAVSVAASVTAAVVFAESSSFV